MKFLYLNLARRADRNERFLRTNPFLEGFERLEAVDGKTLHEQDLLDARLIQESLKAYTPGSLGFALSHRQAWDRCMLSFGIDSMMNKHFRQLDAYICFLPLVWTENDRADSDIQQNWGF